MKILLVDDHEIFAKTVVDAFLQQHEVVHVTSLAEARGELAAAHFAAVLVDFDLPDGKGDSLVAEMRSRASRAFIVAISAHDDGNAALLRAGADAACSKTQFRHIDRVLSGTPMPVPAERGTADALSFTASSQRINEDRALVSAAPWGLLVAVADGAGGTGSGEFAAKTALEVLDNAVAESRSPFTPHELLALLSRIDDVLLDSNTGGETTCVIAQVVGAVLIGASVGDSGAILIRSTGLTDLTVRQVRKPLLGSGSARPMLFGPEPLDGLLLVATDGVMKYAPRVVFGRAMASPDLASARDILLQSVRLPTGALHDDTTGILVHPFRSAAQQCDGVDGPGSASERGAPSNGGRR